MKQILVIEAEPAARQFLQGVLTEEGYEVTLVDNGAAALETMQALHPAMVICDWDLPGVTSGQTVCQEIKAHPILSTPFCLMLMVPGEAAERVKALEMGADDLLSKPIDLAELKARVRAGVRMWQLTQDLHEQKQLLEAELFEAETYVRSLLPRDLNDKVAIQSRFIPSRLLGGDCYDYYWLDPDYLALYLLDVSGHGLGSALLSTSVLNLLRSQSLPDVNFYRPERVIKALNETFQMTEQNEKYFTIWYGVYNQANRQLLYTSAGHPPGIIVSRDAADRVTTTRLHASGMPVGMLPDVQYHWQRCHVPPNSRLYLFSDGIYEIMQDDQAIMGLDDFVDILSAVEPHQTIDDILNEVIVRNRHQPFSDDLSLLKIDLA
ncbi:MAG: SpoIIE family protein phosphatase [Leptolyngbya sp. RL_3_1]|nr:SpoIIE family protein phosphatase [Leptolyngbya sp. RL_3_1]